jgi:(E)-4-hydroxy-3-methylbut-2-enyl-diphosphate synthase
MKEIQVGQLTRRNPTRSVKAGSLTIGGGAPISVQSMCATKTHDVQATAAQAEDLRRAGADLVRVAVDNARDADALAEIRRSTSANLVVDLQENYRVITKVAPHVDKVRYNPGHLYHLEKDRPIRDKVKFIAETAGEHGCALRVGVNCGSVDPDYKARFADDGIQAMVQCALDHCEILDGLGFSNFVVSLKDSDPRKVIDANRRFAAARPDVPLHLGVTEAGLPPDGVVKTRIAFEQLISRGIGDTLRVSLTVPNSRKREEIEAGRGILADIAQGRFRSVPELGGGLNIISCPSCARVENEAFVELAQQVKEMTVYAKRHDITIAVMGCRVNGPGETDDADLGLWCGANIVNLKRKDVEVGGYPYRTVLSKLKEELDRMIAEKAAAGN